MTVIMKRWLDSAISILRSQLVLPIPQVPIPALMNEDDEGLWSLVNRICDQHMPKQTAKNGVTISSRG